MLQSVTSAGILVLQIIMIIMIMRTMLRSYSLAAEVFCLPACPPAF
jgi:hypothetical protein